MNTEPKSYAPSLKRGNAQCPMRCSYIPSGSAYDESPSIVADFNSRTGEAKVRASNRKVSHQSFLTMSITCESPTSSSEDRSVTFDYTIHMYDECYDAQITAPSVTTWQTSVTSYLHQKDQSTQLSVGSFSLDKDECGSLQFSLSGLDERAHRIRNDPETGVTIDSDLIRSRGQAGTNSFMVKACLSSI